MLYCTRFKNAEIKYLNYVGAIKNRFYKNEVKGAESTDWEISIWQKIVHVLASKSVQTFSSKAKKEKYAVG